MSMNVGDIDDFFINLFFDKMSIHFSMFGSITMHWIVCVGYDNFIITMNLQQDLKLQPQLL